MKRANEKLPPVQPPSKRMLEAMREATRNSPPITGEQAREQVKRHLASAHEQLLRWSKPGKPVG